MSERILSGWQALADYGARVSLTGLLLNTAFTGAALAASLGLLYVGRRLIARAARRLPGAPTAEKMVRTSRLARVFGWALRLVCGALAVAAISDIWGVDSLAWLTWAATGVAGRLAAVALTALVAVEVAGYVIHHALAGLASRAATRRRKAQLQTLGPLLRATAQAAILVMAAMMLLSELGLQIGPLLAGAGVVGIAVGFGAQTVVKDLLTGMFLIMEDIVSVGDIVRIGDSGGLVEQMTLRTIRLRDFDGTLHTFPYGEAQVVHNLTKSFSYAVFELQISYGSSIDQATGLMTQVGEGLRADPDFADRILEPIEVVGVDNLADSGVVLKARIKTKPLEQWTVGREYNRRIKLAFDAAGIEIPFPHMTLVLPDRQIAQLVRH